MGLFNSIKNIFTLGSALVSSKGGILLVDEIESAVHKKYMKKNSIQKIWEF